jgi:hypothetical protein
MIYNARMLKLRDIFNAIDADGNGQVSAADCAEAQLPENLERIMQPLFNELG